MSHRSGLTQRFLELTDSGIHRSPELVDTNIHQFLEVIDPRMHQLLTLGLVDCPHLWNQRSILIELTKGSVDPPTFVATSAHRPDCLAKVL